MEAITEWLTLAQASKLLPNRPHVSSIYRWCREGVRGVRLRHMRIGRKIVVSREDIERFGRELEQKYITQPAEPIPTPTRNSSESAFRRRQEIAGRRLDAVGIA